MALSALMPTSLRKLISDYDFVNPFLFQPGEPSYTHDQVTWLPDINHPIIQITQPKKSPLEKDPFTIVYFHGNGCDLGHTRMFAQALAIECAVNVISIEYPGYGLLKDTRPCVSSFLATCTTVVQYILDRMDIKPSKLVLYGCSLGGAAALHVAAYLQQFHHMRVGGVVTQSAFASVQHMAAAVSSCFLGSFLGPLCSSLCVIERLDNLLAISQLSPNTPLLLMHGEKDDLVPLEHVRMLSGARVATVASIITQANAGHNNMSEKVMFKAVNSFLKLCAQNNQAV